MPAVVPFLPLIFSAASGVAKAVGDSKKKTATNQSSYENKQQQSSTQRGILDPQQEAVMRLISAALQRQLGAGPNVLQSDRNQRRTQINNTFDSVRPRLESSLVSRGFGSSGKLGAGFEDLEVKRANSFQDLESQLQSEAMQRWMQSLGFAQQFITPRSFESTGTSTSSGTQTGTQTQPGQSIWNSLSSGFGDIATSLWLRKLLASKGGGSDPYGAESGGGGYEW